jgi:hypothetical protein
MSGHAEKQNLLNGILWIEGVLCRMGILHWMGITSLYVRRLAQDAHSSPRGTAGITHSGMGVVDYYNNNNN